MVYNMSIWVSCGLSPHLYYAVWDTGQLASMTLLPSWQKEHREWLSYSMGLKAFPHKLHRWWAHISLTKAGNTAWVNRARICYSTDRNSEQNNQWWVGRSIYQRAGNYQNRCRKYFQPFNFPKLVITIKLWPNLLKGNNFLSHHNSSPETHRM